MLIATRSSEVLAVPLENTDVQVNGFMDQRPCEVENQRCCGPSFPDLIWTRHAVEPRTGIEFPMILDNILAGEKSSSLSSEVTFIGIQMDSCSSQSQLHYSIPTINYAP